MEDAWAGPVYTQLCAAMQVRAPTQPVPASRIALSKGLASSCGQTENKEAAHLHHVVPGVHCMLWARFAHWWRCTLCAFG